MFFTYLSNPRDLFFLVIVPKTMHEVAHNLMYNMVGKASVTISTYNLGSTIYFEV